MLLLLKNVAVKILIAGKRSVFPIKSLKGIQANMLKRRTITSIQVIKASALIVDKSVQKVDILLWEDMCGSES